MIKTRKAITDDEAWILEKLSQENANHDLFRPEDFIVALDADTDERVGFGCVQYHRNLSDDTEYVELGNIVVLDRASEEQGCLLLVKLAEQAENSGNQQVFTFPHNHHSLFEEVGFVQKEKSALPEVMQERVEEETSKHSNVVPYSEQPKNIEYIIEETDEFEKPEGTTKEEVENIKKELNIDENATTKYSI